MSSKEIEFMEQAVGQIRDLIQRRMTDRVKMMEVLKSAPLDNLPEEILNKREDEASKMRAVIQEQTELLTFIDVLFPLVNQKSK